MGSAHEAFDVGRVIRAIRRRRPGARGTWSPRDRHDVARRVVQLRRRFDSWLLGENHIAGVARAQRRLIAWGAVDMSKWSPDRVVQARRRSEATSSGGALGRTKPVRQGDCRLRLMV